MVAPIIAGAGLVKTLEITGIVLSAIGIGLDIYGIFDNTSDKVAEIPSEFPLVGDDFDRAIENEIRRSEASNNTTIPKSIARRPPIYTPPQLPPIDIPDRKLPKEADNQTDFDTPNGRSISLNTALKDRSFGKLLWNPVSDETIERKVFDYGNVTQKIQTLVKEGDRKYQAYLEGKKELDLSVWEDIQSGFSQLFGGTGIDKSITAWNKTALVFTSNSHSLTGEVRIVYGLKPLSEISWIYYNESRNALLPVIDYIPKKMKIKKQSTGAATTFTVNNLDLASIGNIERVIGPSEFPKTLPKSLTVDEYADDYNPENNKIEIKTFGDLMIWQALQMDALIGQFPIKIKITDTDLLEPGEQEMNIYLPNIAETLRETLGFCINQNTILDALVEMNLRLLIEGAADRKTGLSNYYRLRAIADYLGYKVKQKSEDVDFSFNPSIAAVQTGIPLSEILKPSKQKIAYEDNDDDRTQEHIADVLIEAARIIKGAFWHKWKGADAEKTSIKDQLDEFDRNNEDFDVWLDKIEEGYINDSILTDTLNPYGKNYNQRPRIRNIGKQQGANDGG